MKDTFDVWIERISLLNCPKYSVVHMCGSWMNRRLSTSRFVTLLRAVQRPLLESLLFLRINYSSTSSKVGAVKFFFLIKAPDKRFLIQNGVGEASCSNFWSQRKIQAIQSKTLIRPLLPKINSYDTLLTDTNYTYKANKYNKMYFKLNSSMSKTDTLYFL